VGVGVGVGGDCTTRKEERKDRGEGEQVFFHSFFLLFFFFSFLSPFSSFSFLFPSHPCQRVPPAIGEERTNNGDTRQTEKR